MSLSKNSKKQEQSNVSPSLAELNGSELGLDATAKAVTAAKAAGDVTVLCASAGCGEAAQQAAGIDGVSKVLCADDAAYGNGLAEPVADLIVPWQGTMSISWHQRPTRQKYLAARGGSFGCDGHFRYHSCCRWQHV